jgi:hypothetical protein
MAAATETIEMVVVIVCPLIPNLKVGENETVSLEQDLDSPFAGKEAQQKSQRGRQTTGRSKHKSQRAGNYLEEHRCSPTNVSVRF